MRLLLVEDEQKLADTLAHILKKNGYEVDVSYDGEDGLYNALSDIYDIIILDRMLPGMNGIEVLKNIREEGLKTPVIFLTALDGTKNKVLGLDAGADDYLAKPFSSEELMARIRALSRRREKDVESDNSLSIGKIRYNPGLLMLTSVEGEVKLTFKEGQLFEFLILNKGKTLTKDRIFEKVWGFNTESDVTIVEIYIHHLRKKVSHDKYGIIIETIRGVGYRLKEICETTED